MAQISDVEMADRLSRRRSRVIPLLALLFISGQAMYFGNVVAEPMRNVDAVRIGAWLVWALALLLLLATGGGLFRSKSVRALMEDDVTVENRRRGIAFGFWTAMLTAVALYPLSMVEDLSAREAIHIILTFGIGAALLRFAVLERRALRDG
ncbi:MAG TPA: hypothetical protein VEW25_07400 [Allosphingosinicella sp.]|nr:hypothetical protein [Allosphingosinicella sp.]